jgi:hypothetical protein
MDVQLHLLSFLNTTETQKQLQCNNKKNVKLVEIEIKSMNDN